MSDSWIYLIVNGIAVAISSLLVMAGMSGVAFVTLMVLMVLDFITGIRKSVAFGVDITSRKMRAGLIGKLSTLVLLLSLAILTREIVPEQIIDPKNAVSFLLFLFGTNELCSIGENMKAISDKKEKNYSKFHAVSILCGILKAGVKKITDDRSNRQADR